MSDRKRYLFSPVFNLAHKEAYPAKAVRPWASPMCLSCSEGGREEG